MWTKHTQSLWARCGPAEGGAPPIVAFLWTGLHNHNSSVCVRVHICMCVLACVCVCVCVEPLSHALTMLHCPLDRNGNLCKDSFFPFVSSIPFLRRFCCSPFSHSPVWIPLIRPLSFRPPPHSPRPRPPPPLPPPVLYCQTVSIFCSFSPSVTPPRFSTSVCLPPLHCRRVLISVSSSYTFAVPLPLCCHPSIPVHSLDSFILCLVSCPPPPGQTDTTSC